MQLTRITVLERHALTFAHTQTNKTHACTHTQGEPGNEVGEGGLLFFCGCVYEREREMHGVSFRT